MSSANYNALAGAALTRGQVAGAAIGAGGNVDTDIMCVGDSKLVVEVDMTAAAAGDLTVAVMPFEADNTTVMPINIPVASQTGPTLNGGHDYYIGEFDVSGFEKVRLRITNNNAGGQTLTRYSWRLA